MKIINVIIVAFVFALVSSCGGGSGSSSNIAVPAEPWENINIVTREIVVPATDAYPEYTILEKTQYSLSKFAQDTDGFYILFDGKTLNGWRGYNRDDIPSRWSVDEKEGAIKFSGGGQGEDQDPNGGDLIFGHKFRNFEFSIDWKVSRRGNSGVFYLAQEIKNEPIYISSPESQILDNENHADGRDPKTASSSLYDMIAAEPQNAKPFGEWNNTTILVDKGNVYHFQNGERVLRYNLWTPRWTDMLQNSKFSPDQWHNGLAYELLINVGGANREGYIGLQDHGDDVWFRNIKIKIFD